MSSVCCYVPSCIAQPCSRDALHAQCCVLTAPRLVSRPRATRHRRHPGPRTEPFPRNPLHLPVPDRQLLPHQTSSHGLAHAAMPPCNSAHRRTAAVDRLTSRHSVSCAPAVRSRGPQLCSCLRWRRGCQSTVAYSALHMCSAQCCFINKAACGSPCWLLPPPRAAEQTATGILPATRNPDEGPL